MQAIYFTSHDHEAFYTEEIHVTLDKLWKDAPTAGVEVRVESNHG